MTVLLSFSVGLAIWAVLFFGGMTILKHRKEAHGYRQAAGDRHDSDLGASDITRFAGYASTFPSGPTAGLKESTAEIPILAHKCHALVWAPGGRFYLQSYGGMYGGVSVVETDADARCSAYRSVMEPSKQHAAPSLECSCGFYATSDPDLHSGYGSVRLDVELSGRVIVHERGYRAQHQRVLRAYLPGCHYCGSDASLVWIAEGTRDEPHYIPSSGGFSSFGQPFTPGRTERRLVAYTEARPLCAEHAFKADGEVQVPIEKVMDSIGLPWETS